MLYNTVVGSTPGKKLIELQATNNLGRTNRLSEVLEVVPPNGEVRSKTSDTLSFLIPPPKVKTKPWHKVKSDGDIKMSPYEKGKRTVTYGIGRKPCYQEIGWIYAVGIWDDYPPECPEGWKPSFHCGGPAHVKCEGSWIEQGDLDYWSAYRQVPWNRFDEDKLEKDIQDSLEKLKGSVLADLAMEYDVMTELGELKDSLELIHSIMSAARHPLETFAKTRQSLLKKHSNGEIDVRKLHDHITDAWMQVRYGIMPLVYSLQDIHSVVVGKGFRYKTSRGKDVLRLSDYAPSLPPQDSTTDHIYDIPEGTVIIRAVGKRRYDLDEESVRLMDQVGFNPFLTAWELIPFSFVVDWFVNVGDWILSKTNFSLASQEALCWSVRKNYVVNTYLRTCHDSRYTVTHGGYTDWAYTPEQVVIPTQSLSYGRLTRGFSTLRQLEVNTYERRPFNQSDVKLVFDPFLNWKRWLDTYVLSLGETKRQLRRLSAS